MPPASSLTAESPVPAPPPIIGSPRAICARNRFRMPCRELSTLTSASCGLDVPSHSLKGWVFSLDQAGAEAQPLCHSHEFQQLVSRRVGEVRVVDVKSQL